jgi:hypothetical protein
MLQIFQIFLLCLVNAVFELQNISLANAILATSLLYDSMKISEITELIKRIRYLQERSQSSDI